MGKHPMRLKEVVYMLSPFEQSVMGGLWKDLPHKASHYASILKDAVLFCGLPLYGVVWYAKDYKEKEKQHHRFCESLLSWECWRLVDRNGLSRTALAH